MLQALSFMQVLLAGWLALWTGVLIYHLWIADVLHP